MADKEPTGKLGLLLGAAVAVAALLILLSGGENLGKRSVRGDGDLPPVATNGSTAPASPDTTGGPATPSPNRPIVIPPPAR